MDCYFAIIWSRIFLAKSKKSLVFAELISDLPSEEEEEVYEDTFVVEHIFLISTLDPWYGDIIIYLQILKVPTHLSRDERQWLHHVSKNYLIVDNTLYRRGIDCILRHCLTHDEAEVVLNDCHGGACGGHLSGISTAQKILRVGYFWPSILRIVLMRSRGATLSKCLHWAFIHIHPITSYYHCLSLH